MDAPAESKTPVAGKKEGAANGAQAEDAGEEKKRGPCGLPSKCNIL